MKNKTALIVSLFCLLSSGVAVANSLTIINHTDAKLKLSYANGDKLIKFKVASHMIVSGSNKIYQYQIKQKQEEYLRLKPMVETGTSACLFGIATDGVHGYIAPKYAYKWSASKTDPVFIICQTSKVIDCK